MNNDEIIFLKHSLSDYRFYKKKVKQLNDILNDIEEEKIALAFPRINYDERLNERDPYKTLFESERYSKLCEKQVRIESELRLYQGLIDHTDAMLGSILDPVRSIMIDIYVNEIPAKKVAQKYFYSDDKSMYRVIRNNLKKEF